MPINSNNHRQHPHYNNPIVLRRTLTFKTTKKYWWYQLLALLTLLLFDTLLIDLNVDKNYRHRYSPFTVVDCYFYCPFEKKFSCGYEWQTNLLPFQIINEINSLSAYGMMVMDLANVNLSQAIGGRLIGKYYPTFAMPEACLVMKFLTWGPGISHWNIIQRDTRDKKIYEFINDWSPPWSRSILDQFWFTLTLPIDLTSGSVMFFIEVMAIDQHTTNGLFALDHIVFMYRGCSFKQKRLYPCQTKETCLIF